MVVGWIGRYEIGLQEGCGGVFIYQDVRVALLLFSYFSCILAERYVPRFSTSGKGPSVKEAYSRPGATLSVAVICLVSKIPDQAGGMKENGLRRLMLSWMLKLSKCSLVS